LLLSGKKYGKSITFRCFSTKDEKVRCGWSGTRKIEGQSHGCIKPWIIDSFSTWENLSKVTTVGSLMRGKKVFRYVGEDPSRHKISRVKDNGRRGDKDEMKGSFTKKEATECG
jgi:hypothetical protein